MKKQITILSILIILILTLSGCTDNNTNNKKNELEIINYNIITEAYSYNTSWTSYGGGFNPNSLPEIAFNEAGIYLADEFSKARYRINGTVKNIANYALNSIIVNLNFYDDNNTFLIMEQINNFSKLQPGETWYFEYSYNHNYDYFMNISKLVITTGLPTKDINIPEK